MKEIKDIVKAYDEVKNSDKKLALATVVDVQGSSYRRAGARMLVQDDGIWTGGISGGCLEGDALKKSNLAILKQSSSIITYDTTKDDEHQIGVGLGCKGVIDVLMTPLADGNNSIEVLRSTLGSRTTHTMLTLIATSDQSCKELIGHTTLYDNEVLPAYIAETDRADFINDLSSLKESLKSATRVYGQTKVFIETIPPALRVILFGGNYDIIPLIKIGNELGYIMDVVANPRRVDKQVLSLANRVYEKSEYPQIDDFTGIVLISHDYETDKNFLIEALKTKAKYIGMLGPAVRGQQTIDDIKAAGIDFRPEDHLRFFNPIGLDTGADNPEDIAVSILSEIRAFFNQRTGGHLRQRPGTIYERN